MTYELSICIPTLNRAGFIGETLDSIVAQLEPGVEVVIVDGGSKDDTEFIVATYLERYSCMRYIKRGQGVKASNAGFDRDCSYAVEVSRSSHCWLMTDDDVLKPNAVSLVLESIRAGHDMIIVSCEVRDINLNETLVVSRPGFRNDQAYDAATWDQFFHDVVVHLTFVGAVVVRRDLWLGRHPEIYFGTGFVHVGVMFQAPITGTAIVIAQPLVIIRNGNGQWNARAFDIFMLRWPELIWSFNGVSDSAKQAVTPREPWKLPRVLLLQRAFGRYTEREYKVISSQLGSRWKRAVAHGIALLPLSLLYWPAWLYGHIKHSDPRYFVDTLDEGLRFARKRDKCISH